MATGTYDANGIYQYGEDDNIATFSGLLNLGQASVSTVVGDLKQNRTIANLLLNSNFAINQRSYVSGASLASGAYGFDRWKSTTTSSSMAFTAAPQGQLVTINSGGSFAQIVERTNIIAGTYTLSWSGTATGRIYNSGSTAPAYAASPITVTIDGTQNVVVEFTAAGATKTLQKIQLEPGVVATTWKSSLPTYAAEISACQRYFQRFIPATNGFVNSDPYYSSHTLNFPRPMRVTPSISSTSAGALKSPSGEVGAALNAVSARSNLSAWATIYTASNMGANSACITRDISFDADAEL